MTTVLLRPPAPAGVGRAPAAEQKALPPAGAATIEMATLRPAGDAAPHPAAPRQRQKVGLAPLLPKAAVEGGVDA